MGRSNKIKTKGLGIAFLLFLLGIIIAPKVDFDLAYSKAIYDREGQLLGGKIAEDGQWRFPVLDLSLIHI